MPPLPVTRRGDEAMLILLYHWVRLEIQLETEQFSVTWITGPVLWALQISSDPESQVTWLSSVAKVGSLDQQTGFGLLPLGQQHSNKTNSDELSFASLTASLTAALYCFKHFMLLRWTVPYFNCS
jgi:hypothetical protein